MTHRQTADPNERSEQIKCLLSPPFIPHSIPILYRSLSRRGRSRQWAELCWLLVATSWCIVIDISDPDHRTAEGFYRRTRHMAPAALSVMKMFLNSATVHFDSFACATRISRTIEASPLTPTFAWNFPRGSQIHTVLTIQPSGLIAVSYRWI